jgi:hypothetical protein
MQNISLALIGESVLLLFTQVRMEVAMLLKPYKIGSLTVHANERFLSALVFVLGVTISVILPNVLFAAVSGSFTLPFILFFVASSLGVIMGFAFYIPKVRSFQQRETFRLLKTQHKEFFQQIRSNVTRLLEKGRCDEKFLPGRS